MRTIEDIKADIKRNNEERNLLWKELAEAEKNLMDIQIGSVINRAFIDWDGTYRSSYLVIGTGNGTIALVDEATMSVFKAFINIGSLCQYIEQDKQDNGEYVLWTLEEISLEGWL